MKASAPMVVNASLCETEKYSMVWLPLNTPSPNPTTGSLETVRWGWMRVFVPVYWVSMRFSY